MKMSNRMAMVRWLLKNNPARLKEPGLVEAIRFGVATRQEVYGFHPTKGGSNHGRKKPIKQAA